MRINDLPLRSLYLHLQYAFNSETTRSETKPIGGLWAAVCTLIHRSVGLQLCPSYPGGANLDFSL